MHNEVEEEAQVEPDDIIDPNAYSVEEDKQKSEEDDRMATAEGRKELTREFISELRREYNEIVAHNNSLPPNHRLSQDELIVDPELLAEVKGKGERLCAETRREESWTSEQIRLQLEKV
jgi:cilia- and flagella-associated protein 44